MKKMMTQKTVLALLCLTLCSCLFFANGASAQAVRDVQQIIEASNYDQTNQTLAKTSDGGYFVVAPLAEPGSINKLMCYKLNPDQTVAWQRALEYPSSGGFMQVTDVKQCNDQGYIICGRMSDEGVFSGCYLLKLDPGAGFQWMQRYTEGMVSYLSSVVESNGGFIAVGASNTNVGVDGLILGTDAWGNTQWAHRVRGQKRWQEYPGTSFLTQVIRLSEAEFATVGSTNAMGGESDAVVVKFDYTGNIIDKWVYGDHMAGGVTSYEEGAALKYDPADNVLTVTGRAMRGSSMVCGDIWYSDIWVWRTNAQDGSIMWSNRYDIINVGETGDVRKFPHARDIDGDNSQTGIGGTIDVWLGPGSYHYNSFIIRLSPDGSMYNNRYYPHDGDNNLWKLIRTNGQSYVAGGDSRAWTGTPQVKLIESYDNILEHCEMEEPEFAQTEFPVAKMEADLSPVTPEAFKLGMKEYQYPFKEHIICERELLDGKPAREALLPGAKMDILQHTAKEITASIPGSQDGPAMLLITDASGRLFRNVRVRNNDKVSLDGLAAGIYFARISHANELLTKKIVIAR